MTVTRPGYQSQVNTFSILFFGIEPASLDAISNTFSDEVTIISTANGSEGIKEINRHAVDLVFAFQHGGDMKGSAFLKQVRKKTADAKCVLIAEEGDLNLTKQVSEDVSIHWFRKQEQEFEKLRFIIKHEIFSLRRASELRQSEAKYKSAFDSMSDIFTRADMDGIITMVSPSSYPITGYMPEEVVGKKMADFYEDPTERDRLLERLMKHKSVENMELKVVRKDGQIITVSTNTKIVYDKKGEAIAVEGNVRDITDKKRAEQALIESKQTLSEAQKIANLGNWRWDIVNSETYWSDNIYHILGADPEKVSPSRDAFFEFVHPEDKPLLGQRVQIILSDHVPFSIDHRIIKSDGEVRYVNSRARMDLNEDGRPIRLYGILQDITHRIKREEELRIKDKAIASAISGIGMTDAEGKLIYANDALVKMWGYNNAKEMLGKSLPDFWEGDGVFQTIADLKDRGWDKGENIGRKKDGSLFHVEYSAHMINDQKGNPNVMFGSFFDITDRKKAEKELQESEEKFKGIFDSMVDVFSRSDPQGNCLLISPSVVDVIGYTPEEIIGKNYADFYSNPQDWRKLNEQLLEKGEMRNIESVIRKKDGSTTIVSSNAKVVYDEIGMPSHIDSLFRDMSAFKKT